MTLIQQFVTLYQETALFIFSNNGQSLIIIVLIIPHINTTMGGCILLHNDIYAISEEKKNLILDDYILFLKTNLFRLKLSGASKFIITFSTYTNKEIRFLLMRWQEMEKLVAFKDIGINVTLDIFLFSKNKYNYIIRDMNKERRLYEKVQGKTHIQKW